MFAAPAGLDGRPLFAGELPAGRYYDLPADGGDPVPVPSGAASRVGPNPYPLRASPHYQYPKAYVIVRGTREMLPPSDIPSGIFTTEADKGSWDAETLVDVDEFGSAKDAAPSLKDSELVLGKLVAASHNEVLDAQLDALTEAELDARLRATVARAAPTAEPGTPSQTPLSGTGRIGALTQGAGDQLGAYLAAVENTETTMDQPSVEEDRDPTAMVSTLSRSDTNDDDGGVYVPGLDAASDRLWANALGSVEGWFTIAVHTSEDGARFLVGDQEVEVDELARVVEASEAWRREVAAGGVAGVLLVSCSAGFVPGWRAAVGDVALGEALRRALGVGRLFAGTHPLVQKRADPSDVRARADEPARSVLFTDAGVELFGPDLFAAVQAWHVRQTGEPIASGTPDPARLHAGLVGGQTEEHEWTKKSAAKKLEEEVQFEAGKANFETLYGQWLTAVFELGDKRSLLQYIKPELNIGSLFATNNPYRDLLKRVGGELLQRRQKHFVSGRPIRQNLTKLQAAHLIGLYDIRKSWGLSVVPVSDDEVDEQSTFDEEQLKALAKDRKAQVELLVRWWHDSNYDPPLLELLQRKKVVVKNTNGKYRDDIKDVLREEADLLLASQKRDPATGWPTGETVGLFQVLKLLGLPYGSAMYMWPDLKPGASISGDGQAGEMRLVRHPSRELAGRSVGGRRL